MGTVLECWTMDYSGLRSAYKGNLLFVQDEKKRTAKEATVGGARAEAAGKPQGKERKRTPYTK